MNGLFDGAAATFCLRIMKKLEREVDFSANIDTVLVDLCDYLGFGHGFIYYQENYGQSLIGHAVSMDVSEQDTVPDTLVFDCEDSRDLLAQLSGKKMISSFSDEVQTLAEQQIGETLHLKSYILAPVIGEEKQITALIGLGDIKQNKQTIDVNLSVAYSAFVIILNYLKAWHYSEGIQKTEKALASIANNMGVDIYVNDFNNHDVLYVNQSMAVPYGGAAQMIGKKCWKALYEDKTGQCEYCPQKKLIDHDGKPTKIYSWDYMRPFDQSWFRVLSVAFRWEDGRLAHIVSSIDITEHKRKEELIRRIAEYDTLTGLSNRRRLFGDGDKLLEISRQESRSFYVLFFDLNKFKQVNDVYGHRAGDELLSQVGAFLNECSLSRERSYRYGGDEFVLLLPDMTKEEVIAVASVLQERFSNPWKLTTCDAVCRASIGIAEYPLDGSDMDELLDAADSAMYEAKKNQGKEIVFH